jgi:Hepatocellular carcinoma-associated antigen 59
MKVAVLRCVLIFLLHMPYFLVMHLQIAWNTGIAEVDLPIDVKLRNIEETRRAKTAFEQSQKSRADRYHSNNLNTADGNSGNPNASAVVGSFTANYSHHSREYASKMRQREMTRQKEGGWTNKDGTVTHREPQLPTVPVPDANKPSVLQGDASSSGKTSDSSTSGQHQQRSGAGYRRGKDGSSDDKVYERFKKRTRRF